MSDPVVLIPARMASTRLPDKPLADIHGEPMIVHVWRRAVEAGLGPVVVATDEPRIVDAVERAGGIAVMTRADHPSGSDRIFEAVEAFDPEGRHDVVVNVQGDLPTIDPRAVQASILPLSNPAVDIATLAVEIVREEERTNPNVVKAIGSTIAPGRMRALYFTRATAPSGEGPLYHHVGLYAYRRRALARFVVAAAVPAREARAAGAVACDRGRHADRRRRRGRRASGRRYAARSRTRSRHPRRAAEISLKRFGIHHAYTQQGHRLSGRTRRQLPHRVPRRLPGLGAAALRDFRGRIRRHPGRNGGAGHDPDRELDRGARGRHPPFPAGIGPATSSASTFCRSISSFSPSRARRWRPSSPSTAMSMRSGNAARSSASWASSQ